MHARKSGTGKLKAISPLIATVLLISFTFTLAAIVAGWGQNIVTQSSGKTEKIQQQQAACSGGTIQYVFTGGPANPTVSGNQIKAQIQVDGVSLGNFTFVITLNNLETLYLADVTKTSLAPGPKNIGTIASETLNVSRENITSVMITSNCPDSKTIAKPLG